MGALGAAGHASGSVLCQQHRAKRLVHRASESPAFGRGSDVRKCMNLCMGHRNSSKDTVSRHNL